MQTSTSRESLHLPTAFHVPRFAYRDPGGRRPGEVEFLHREDEDGNERIFPPALALTTTTTTTTTLTTKTNINTNAYQNTIVSNIHGLSNTDSTSTETDTETKTSKMSSQAKQQTQTQPTAPPSPPDSPFGFSFAFAPKPAAAAPPKAQAPRAPTSAHSGLVSQKSQKSTPAPVQSRSRASTAPPPGSNNPYFPSLDEQLRREAQGHRWGLESSSAVSDASFPSVPRIPRKPETDKQDRLEGGRPFFIALPPLPTHAINSAFGAGRASVPFNSSSPSSSKAKAGSSSSSSSKTQTAGDASKMPPAVRHGLPDSPASMEDGGSGIGGAGEDYDGDENENQNEDEERKLRYARVMKEYLSEGLVRVERQEKIERETGGGFEW